MLIIKDEAVRRCHNVSHIIDNGPKLISYENESISRFYITIMTLADQPALLLRRDTGVRRTWLREHWRSRLCPEEREGEKKEAYYGPRMNCVVERGIIRIRPSDITIATDT